MNNAALRHQSRIEKKGPTIPCQYQPYRADDQDFKEDGITIDWRD